MNFYLELDEKWYNYLLTFSAGRIVEIREYIKNDTRNDI